jgi:hypothetical protein
VVTASGVEVGTVEWMYDRVEAFKLARSRRMPILIDVYQDNCGGCDKLDQVTFSAPEVVEAVQQRFIPLKVHLMKDRAFTREHQVWWTPTLMIADHSGRVRYTSVNYLPPAETLDVLDIGEGLTAMRWMGYEKAIGLFRKVEERRPDGPMTAEAMYWRGMAEYFRDGKKAASSRAVWNQIAERFPDSIWAKRQP